MGYTCLAELLGQSAAPSAAMCVSSAWSFMFAMTCCMLKDCTALLLACRVPDIFACQYMQPALIVVMQLTTLKLGYTQLNGTLPRSWSQLALVSLQ